MILSVPYVCDACECECIMRWVWRVY